MNRTTQVRHMAERIESPGCRAIALELACIFGMVRQHKTAVAARSIEDLIQRLGAEVPR